MSNRLAIGTVQFGLQYGIANQTGPVSANKASKILLAARAAGIDTLDTAIAYGDSEKILGQVGVADWKVISKLPELPDNVENVAEWVNGQIEGTLSRLGISQLYAVLLHRPDQLFEARGKQLLEALKATKVQAQSRKIGVSVYSPVELERLFNEMHFDLVQVPMNILDRRLVDSGWARRLKSLDVEVHTRSVFLQGLLLMTDQQRPVKFERWQNIWTEWSRWLGEAGLSPLEACLRYAFTVDEIDKIIVGVDSVIQLHEILNAVSGSLETLPSWPRTIDRNLLNPAYWNQI